MSPPIVASSAFGFDNQEAIDDYFTSGDGYLYSRHENPTVNAAERLLATLEGAESATLFASGMAAITTVLITLGQPRRLIAAQADLYGGTVVFLRDLAPQLGLDVRWLPRQELNRLGPADLEGCDLLWVETPVNPTLRLIDLRHVSEVARQAGARVAVDSTFATPMLQRPLELGCDLVVHSLTKYLGGHSDLSGGAVATSREIGERLARARRAFGGIADPFSAFLVHRGMRTLAVRMEAHCRNAHELARALSGHPRVREVLYPGLPDHPDHELARRQMDAFGGMLSLLLEGGAARTESVHDRLRLFKRAGTLGSVDSLVSIPARMSHRSLDPEERAVRGIPQDLLRLSVGLESVADLREDLEQALG